jgi:hypothetical protein
MKKLFVELLNERCITYALRILGGRTPRTPPLNPPLESRMEKVKGGRRVGKEYLSSGCLVVNSSSDVFFLIKTEENRFADNFRFCLSINKNGRIMCFQ